MPSTEMFLPQLGLDPRVPLPPAGPPAPWHVRFNSGELAGPATSDDVYGWLRTGRLTADAWVWHDGWSDWRPAGAMFLQLRKDDVPPPVYAPGGFRLQSLADDDQPAAVICDDVDDSAAIYRPTGDPFRSGLATIVLLATCAALVPVLGWVLLAQSGPPHSTEAALHHQPAAHAKANAGR